MAHAARPPPTHPVAVRRARVKDEPIKPVVVVIDDDEHLRRRLRATLKAKGCKVFDAENGQKGLEEIADRTSLTAPG